jgi:hypothetical protein
MLHNIETLRNKLQQGVRHLKLCNVVIFGKSSSADKSLTPFNFYSVDYKADRAYSPLFEPQLQI